MKYKYLLLLFVFLSCKEKQNGKIIWGTSNATIYPMNTDTLIIISLEKDLLKAVRYSKNDSFVIISKNPIEIHLEHKITHDTIYGYILFGSDTINDFTEKPLLPFVKHKHTH
jgi:hypothetical protein